MLFLDHLLNDVKPHFCCKNRMTRRQEGKCMRVCKWIRTARSSIRMRWDHMTSETSAERFVFRARAGPLCPSECLKMQLCGHNEKAATSIWTMTVLLCPHQCKPSKSPVKLGCLAFSLCCFPVHTPSHVSSEVCTFSHPLTVACQSCRPLVLHALCNHGENVSENPSTCTY
jgi:hypothetical protein